MPNKKTVGVYAPLLKDISQYEVDFVIPRAGIDLPLGIDPFLLYKSRDPHLAPLHAYMMRIVNNGIAALRQQDENIARTIFQFPEVAEIGLGYAQGSKRGSGVGAYTTDLMIETLLDAPELLRRGLQHIEELQLLSVGIGPD